MDEAATRKDIDEIIGIVRDFMQQVDERFTHVDEQFTNIEKEIDELKQSHDCLVDTIDGFVARIDRYETELPPAIASSKNLWRVRYLKKQAFL